MFAFKVKGKGKGIKAWPTEYTEKNRKKGKKKVRYTIEIKEIHKGLSAGRTKNLWPSAKGDDQGDG